jgi:hypothetical protein
MRRASGLVTRITEHIVRSADIQEVHQTHSSGHPQIPALECALHAPKRSALLDEISITIAFFLLGITWLTLRGMDGREGKRSRR